MKRKFALELQQLLEEADIDTNLRVAEGGRLEVVRRLELCDHRITAFVVSKTVLSPLTKQDVEMVTIEVQVTTGYAMFPLIRQFVAADAARDYILSHSRDFYNSPFGY